MGWDFGEGVRMDDELRFWGVGLKRGGGGGFLGAGVGWGDRKGRMGGEEGVELGGEERKGGCMKCSRDWVKISFLISPASYKVPFSIQSRAPKHCIGTYVLPLKA